MSGTHLAFGGTGADCVMMLCVHYAVSGTDVAYGGTRRRQVRTAPSPMKTETRVRSTSSTS
eukprot:3290106-Rhodomonas_salina.1